MMVQKILKKLNVHLVFCYSYFLLFILTNFAIYNDYDGNYFIYSFYSISINLLFFISLFRGPLLSIFFFLTWLGFWFKVSLPHLLNYFFFANIKSPNLREAVQYFDIFIDNKVIEKIMIDFSIIFLFLSIVLFFFKNQKNYLNFNKIYYFRINQYLLFLCILIFVVFNYSLGIYHKGFYDQFFTNKLFSLAFKFLYYFLPNYFLFELLNHKKDNSISYRNFFSTIICINFFLYTFMLSREYIFFSFILFAYIFFDKKMKLDLFFLSKIILIFLTLATLNLKITKDLRLCKLNNYEEKPNYSINFLCFKNMVNSFMNIDSAKEKLSIQNDKKNINASNVFADFFGIAASRWVGFESVYMKKINYDYKNLKIEQKKFSNQNFIPGIFYLLYNENIYIFLSYSVFFCLLLILINRILLNYFLNYYQYIFLSYILSYRIFHSGVNDKNTILFIIILISIIVIINHWLFKVKS